MSLYLDADRAESRRSGGRSNAKMQADFNQKQAAAVRAAFEKELEKFPAAEPCCNSKRRVRRARTEKRTAEQKKLVASNPKLNITPGVLYQYDTKADNELKALQAKIHGQTPRRARPAGRSSSR